MAHGLQQALDALAARVGRPIAAFDRDLMLVGHSSHTDAVDPVRSESILTRSATDGVRARVPSLRLDHRVEHLRVSFAGELDMHPRVVVPLRYDDAFVGTLWVSDPDGALSTTVCLSLEDEAPALAALVHAERYGLASDDGLAQLAAELLGGTRAAREDAWDAAVARGTLGATSVVVGCALRADPGSVVTTVLAEVGRHAGCRFLVLSEGTVTRAAAVVTRDGRQRLLDAFGTVLAEGDPCAGVGHAVRRGDSLTEAVAAAVDAVTVAVAVPAMRPVADWRSLGLFRMAVRTRRLGDADLPELRPLLDRGTTEQWETVEAYLDRGGDVRATAEFLSLHRGSVYYRLRTVEQLLGATLDDGQLASTLHLATKLRRLGTLPVSRTASSPSTQTRP